MNLKLPAANTNDARFDKMLIATYICAGKSLCACVCVCEVFFCVFEVFFCVCVSISMFEREAGDVGVMFG